MRRRGYLTTLGAALLAGCGGQTGFIIETPALPSEADRAATPTEAVNPATDAQPPTAAPPTETTTPTPTDPATEAETPTTEPEPATPESTPTRFERSVGRIHAALRSVYRGYLEQADEAETLTDVDASVTSFTSRDLGDENTRVNEELDAARPHVVRLAQNRQLLGLERVRRFLWKAAQTQERLGNAYDHLRICYHALEDEDANAATTQFQRATLHEFRGARAGYRASRSVGQSSDADAVAFLDADEWAAKLGQFGAEVDTLADLTDPLESFIDGIEDLAIARRQWERGREESGRDAADDAVDHLKEAGRELRRLRRRGVADSMAELVESYHTLAGRKRERAADLFG